MNSTNKHESETGSVVDSTHQNITFWCRFMQSYVRKYREIGCKTCFTSPCLIQDWVWAAEIHVAPGGRSNRIEMNRRQIPVLLKMRIATTTNQTLWACLRFCFVGKKPSSFPLQLNYLVISSLHNKVSFSIISFFYVFLSVMKCTSNRKK